MTNPGQPGTKKRRKIPWVALVLLTALAFWCVPRIQTFYRFAVLAHAPAVPADFSTLERALPKGERITAIYRGLPHPLFDKREFATQLWLSPYQRIHEYPFETTALRDDGSLRAALEKTLTAPETFEAHLGAKGCGGFHPDFAVRFGQPPGERWVLVCLGCHEALCFSPDAGLRCDLSRTGAKTLENEWKPWGISR